jgi:hypothetical protein
VRTCTTLVLCVARVTGAPCAGMAAVRKVWLAGANTVQQGSRSPCGQLQALRSTRTFRFGDGHPRGIKIYIKLMYIYTPWATCYTGVSLIVHIEKERISKNTCPHTHMSTCTHVHKHVHMHTVPFIRVVHTFHSRMALAAALTGTQPPAGTHCVAPQARCPCLLHTAVPTPFMCRLAGWPVAVQQDPAASLVACIQACDLGRIQATYRSHVTTTLHIACCPEPARL